MESKKRMAALENEKKKEDTRMSQWIDAVFGDAFIAYTHLKALSAFVEAVLRYGLNKDGAPDYVSFLVEPRPKKEAAVRKTLEELYKPKGETKKGKDDEEAGGPMMARKEYFDYVSETI